MFVGGIVLPQTRVQLHQPNVHGAKPNLVRDLHVEQTPECIAEGAEVGGMHRVDNQVVDGHAWTSKQIRGLVSCRGTRVHVGFV